MRETNWRLTAGFDVDLEIASISEADRLAGPGIPPGRDAGQHLLEHHIRQPVACGEVRVRAQLDLVLAVDAAGARALDRHAPAAERDLAAIVTVTNRGPIPIVPALGANDPVDLGLHQLAQHAKPNPDTECEQSFLRGTGELAQRLPHRARQLVDPLLAGCDRRSRTVLMAVGPAVLVD